MLIELAFKVHYIIFLDGSDMRRVSTTYNWLIQSVLCLWNLLKIINDRLITVVWKHRTGVIKTSWGYCKSDARAYSDTRQDAISPMLHNRVLSDLPKALASSLWGEITFWLGGQTFLTLFFFFSFFFCFPFISTLNDLGISKPYFHIFCTNILESCSRLLYGCSGCNVFLWDSCARQNYVFKKCFFLPLTGSDCYVKCLTLWNGSLQGTPIKTPLFLTKNRSISQGQFSLWYLVRSELQRIVLEQDFCFLFKKNGVLAGVTCKDPLHDVVTPYNNLSMSAAKKSALCGLFDGHNCPR